MQAVKQLACNAGRQVDSGGCFTISNQLISGVRQDFVQQPAHKRLAEDRAKRLELGRVQNVGYGWDLPERFHGKRLYLKMIVYR